MREEDVERRKNYDEFRQVKEFPIKVTNKFDDDKRCIVVCHREREKQEETCYTICYTDPKQTPQEKLFTLTPDDVLIIELDDETGDFTRDVYIELPYVADFELFWKVGGKRVDRPITRIVRDTNPKRNKRLDDGRTIVVIPRDQRAWKLKIRCPKNVAEYYQTRDLLDGFLENQGGTPDNVSIGDNGP